MRSRSLLSAGLGLALLLSAPARAQATRTWVSGTGDDANPCSRTAPCLTLAGAAGKTAAGGEIDVLDPASVGPLTITRALTVDGRGMAGVTASAGGITVAAGPGDVVVLRGLAVRATQSGTSGVRFVSGKALHLEDVHVQGFTGHGVDFQPEAGGRLFARNLVASGNGGAGVRVASSAGEASALLQRSAARANASGVSVGAGAKVTLYEATASGNSGAGLDVSVDGEGRAELNVEGASLTHNALGVRAAAATGEARVRLSRALVADNTTAPVAREGRGDVLSFGNNRVVGGALRAATRTVLVLPAAAVTAGSAVLLTARVEDGAGEPAGTVTFLDGAQPLGSAPLVLREARLEVAGLAAGAHVLQAAYGGDARSAGSTSATATLTVTAPASGADAGSPGGGDGGTVPTPDGGSEPVAPVTPGACGCGTGGPPLGAGLLLLLALARATRRTLARRPPG
jgi:hypothetical protein